MSRFALAATIGVGILAGAPAVTDPAALACTGTNHPSGKLVAIDEALPTTKIAESKLAEVRELRQKAYGLTVAGKFAEAHEAANSALKILGVEWKPELRGPPTRC
jgi:hypothetical protein